jgi:predicted anti-sigma-YlaC factor YlaD
VTTGDHVLDLVDLIAAGDETPSADVEAHLDTCAACRAALAHARAVDRMLRARQPAPPPAQFTARTLSRIRRDKWRREQVFDAGFNAALAVLGAAIAAGVWVLMHQAGTAMIVDASGDAFSLVADQVGDLIRRIAPSVPLYIEAAALLLSALGIWWWAERGTFAR